MDAGRELDALIAEKVFGKEIVWYASNHSKTPTQWHVDELDRQCGGGVVPSYSTDIAAAWRVVEHMQELGWQIEIAWDGPRFNAWVVELWLPPEGREDLGANGETAPLAICRAALAALGG